MTEEPDVTQRARLRQRAEQRLLTSRIGAVDFSLDDAKRLIHELNVHQIELDLQNEELRVTQIALETSHRKYIDLYEFSPIGLLTLDNNERIQEANLTFVTMLGIDREKLVKRNLSDFIDRSAQDTYHFFLQALYRTQQPQQCEISLLPPNHPPLVVQLDGTVLVQAENQISCRIAVSDITERHQSEMEIERLYIAEQEARTQAERTARRLASLQQIAAAMSRAMSYEQVADAGVHQSISHIGACRGEILLLSDDSTTLHSRGSRSGSEHAVSLSLSDSAPWTEALLQQKPVWIPSMEEYCRRYPQAEGMPAENSQAFAFLPLIVNERSIGILIYSFAKMQTFPEEDLLFMQALAHQCEQALERVRLTELARDSAAMQERQRLARDLHDSVKQSLFASTSMSEALPRLMERDPGRAREILAKVIDLNRAALAQMQSVLFELLPASIVKTPMAILLHQLSEAMYGHREFTAEVQIQGEELALPAEVHMAVYRIAQESLNNVLKHSQATQFSVHLRSQPDLLTLVVRDNGVGFDPSDPAAGLGLAIMEERAAAIQATLNIASRVGTGTEVTLLWKPPAS
ncbi:MAG: GAF domain-containing protein [Chloroflexi bacterium]|nr:GAF domain-containing protein [Chloroflexota bacterium]